MSKELHLDAQNGVVVLFDILGYQRFLAANAPETATKEVLSFLLNIRESGQKQVQDLFNQTDAPHSLNKHFEAIGWLVISDTILITCPLGGVARDELPLRWMAFLFHCAALSRELFDFGLPARGAIAEGNYFIKESCFAGRPIVDAYGTLTQLDIAACVFTESARTRLYNDFPSWLEIGLLTEYLIPLRDGNEATFLTVLPKLGGLFEDATFDVRQYLNDAFRGHHKDLPMKAYRKFANTEMYFRYAMSRYRRARKEEAEPLPTKESA